MFWKFRQLVGRYCSYLLPFCPGKVSETKSMRGCYQRVGSTCKCITENACASVWKSGWKSSLCEYEFEFHATPCLTKTLLSRSNLRLDFYSSLLASPSLGSSLPPLAFVQLNRVVMTVQEPLLLLRQQLAPVGCGGVLLGLEQVLARVVMVVEVVDVARHGARHRRWGGGRVATLANTAAFEHSVAGIRALNYQKCHKGEIRYRYLRHFSASIFK